MTYTVSGGALNSTPSLPHVVTKHPVHQATEGGGAFDNPK